MNLNQTINLIDQHIIFTNVCDHSKQNGWTHEKPIFWDEFIRKGQVNIYPKRFGKENYWKEDSQIILSDYPYHSCEIFECPKCNRLFFKYLELGGHVPEKRYRLINPKLINNNIMSERIETVHPFSISNYAEKSLFIHHKYDSKRIVDQQNFEEESRNYLDEIMIQNIEEDFYWYLWSYDSSLVKIIGLNIKFTPGAQVKIVLDKIAKSKIIEETKSLRYRIKGYYKFIDFQVEITSLSQSQYLKINFDFDHSSLDDYRLYFNDNNYERSNIIKCRDASVELKRYQFYNMVVELFRFFKHHFRTSYKINFSELLFHFFDTNIPSMYCVLIDLISRITKVPATDLDIEYRDVSLSFNKTRYKVSKIGLYSKRRGDVKSRLFLVNRECKLISKDIDSVKLVSFPDEEFILVMNNLLDDKKCFYPILRSESMDKAIIFYDDENNGIFGVNYDSENGILRDHLSSMIGTNSFKINLLNRIFE